MSSSNYRFTLNVQDEQSQVSLPVRLCDTNRSLYISIADGGKPLFIENGSTAWFFGKKADETEIITSCIIEKNTYIRYDFTEQTASYPGTVDCEIRLYNKEGKEIASPRFIMVVDERVVFNNDIVSKDYVTAIDQVLATDAIAQGNEATREANEETRVDNEIERRAAESERQSTFENNESQRQTDFAYAQSLRQSSFDSDSQYWNSTFAESENSRQSTFENNESDRQAEFRGNEDSRVSTFEQAEEARDSRYNDAEEARQSAFTTAEASRQSTFNTAENSRAYDESKRVSVESDRVYAEKGRVYAEQTRENRESTRQIAEQYRVQDENSRNTYEQTRRDAEKTRVSAESGRVNAENTRVGNENTRIANENARESAEQGRAEAESTRALRMDAVEKKVEGCTNAIKASASGEVVRADGVSTNEHTIKCKVKSDSNIDLTSVKVTRRGKNLLKYPYYYKSSTVKSHGITFTDKGDGTVIANGTATATVTYYLQFHEDRFALDKGKQYFLSGCPSGGSSSTYIIQGTDGTLYYTDFGDGNLFTANGNGCYFYIVVYEGTTLNNVVFKPQLELGTTATEYVAPVEATTYTPLSDGTVEGIRSVAPTMTLMTDTAGVTIEVEYNQDINVLLDYMRASLRAILDIQNSLIGGEA